MDMTRGSNIGMTTLRVTDMGMTKGSDMGMTRGSNIGMTRGSDMGMTKGSVKPFEYIEKIKNHLKEREEKSIADQKASD